LRLAYPFLYFGKWHKKIINYPVNNRIIFAVRVNTIDKLLIWEIWKLKQYGKVPKNSVIVDIGAHIGAYAIYAALNAKKVFAFEPHPANYKLMLHNIKQNKIKNIKTFQKAVSSKKGRIKLFISKVNTGMHSLYETESKKKILVNSTTVPEIITRYRIPKIDILKIDAEGAEYDIILNLPKKTLNKIKTIIFEYHDYLNLKHNLNDIKAHLKNQGYRIDVHGGWIMNKIFKEGYVIAKKI